MTSNYNPSLWKMDLKPSMVIIGVILLIQTLLSIGSLILSMQLDASDAATINMAGHSAC